MINTHWAYTQYAKTWKPVVAYNSVAQKYIVAWRETPGTDPLNDTQVAHIRANKAFDAYVPPATNVILSATSGSENPRYPAIAASTIDPTALVVWEDARDSLTQEMNIYGNFYSTTAASNTQTGFSVMVDLGSNNRVTFDHVITAGTTNLATATTGTPPPADYSVVPFSAPVYYSITTTATFTDDVQVCLAYDDTGMPLEIEAGLKMMVYESAAGSWQEVTTNRDTTANLLYGTVNHLSEFAIMLYTGSGTISQWVTNTDDAGPGSLRQAILQANDHVGPDTIRFQIPQSDPNFKGDGGFWTIQPLTLLPAISDPQLLIDGLSQAVFIGSDTNPEGPEIEIDGYYIGDESGLRIETSGVEVRGLVINRCARAGIMVYNADGGKITSCYLGTGPKGMQAKGNGYGVWVWGKSRFFLIAPPGPDLPGNLIADNSGANVFIQDSSYHVVVSGNRIGLDRSGTAKLGSSLHGVCVQDGCNRIEIFDNRIGGNDYGIYIANSDSTAILNNFIGTDETWQLDLGNQYDGVHIDNARANQIIENVIGFNGANGVKVMGSAAIGNRISRNSISQNGLLGIENIYGGNLELAPPEIFGLTENGIDGTAGPGQMVEIFSTPNGDYEGQVFLGSGTADVDGSFIVGISELGVLTATTTDLAGNTSEFCAPYWWDDVETNLISKTPSEFSLQQNFPNPFNPTTTITYAVKEKCRVVLSVFDLLGREIAVLIDAERPPGTYQAVFGSGELPSGLYFCKIRMKDFTAMKKMVRLE